MPLMALLVAFLAADAPQVEVSTLSGERHKGRLASASDSGWKIDADGKTIELPAADVLLMRHVSVDAPQAEKPPVEVSLTNGSILTAESIQATAKELKVKSTSTGETSLLRSTLASIRLAPLGSHQDAWQKMVTQERRQDWLVTDKGEVLDFYEGVIGEISATHVHLLLDGDSVPVPREKVFGLLFYQPSGTRSRPATGRVDLVGGDRLFSRAVELQGDHLVVSLAAGPETKIPIGQIRSIDFSFGKLTWLSDIKPREIRHDFQFIDVVPEYRPDRDIYGDRLKLAGRIYERGVCIRSKTTVRYRLDGDYTRFQALMGIQHGYAGDVQVSFVVDGKQLSRAEVQPGGQEPVKVDLDVNGKFSLEVVVDYGKAESDIGDHLVLANARLLK